MRSGAPWNALCHCHWHSHTVLAACALARNTHVHTRAQTVARRRSGHQYEAAQRALADGAAVLRAAGLPRKHSAWAALEELGAAVREAAGAAAAAAGAAGIKEPTPGDPGLGLGTQPPPPARARAHSQRTITRGAGGGGLQPPTQRGGGSKASERVRRMRG
jgi:hypothetical protein